MRVDACLWHGPHDGLLHRLDIYECKDNRLEDNKNPGLEVIKLFFMLNSIMNENTTNTKNRIIFPRLKLSDVVSMLINKQMPTIAVWYI